MIVSPANSPHPEEGGRAALLSFSGQRIACNLRQQGVGTKLVPRNSILTESYPFHLGIVCPMANEATTVEEFVPAVLAQCQGVERLSFFIVLDNVCKDRTREILEGLARSDDRLKAGLGRQRIAVWSMLTCAVIASIGGGMRLDSGDRWRVQSSAAGYTFVSPQNVGKAMTVCSARASPLVGGLRIVPLKRKYISWGGTLLTKFFWAPVCLI